MNETVRYHKVSRTSEDDTEANDEQQQLYTRFPPDEVSSGLIQRVLRQKILLPALVCFLLIIIGISITLRYTQPWERVADEPLNIAIQETGGFHDEVIAALIHSFGSQPHAELELYQPWQRYGIKAVFDKFELSNPLPEFKKPDKFNATTYQPTILVSTTCELDSVSQRAQWNILLEREQTFLFCIIHHADRWQVTSSSHDILKPWVKKGLVNFVALSKHTQIYLDSELKKWELEDIEPVTRHLVPVFPVDFSETEYALGNTTQNDNLFFALQGNYESSRRDYGKIFEHLGNFLGNFTPSDAVADGEGGSPDIQLRLLGHGKRPTVPEALLPHVKFDESLNYLDFYGILSETFALLPAFANDEYLDRKASSSVPAALIAGTPLVANQAILDSYTYLSKDMVWFQTDSEDDFDVVGKILNKASSERNSRKVAVRYACNKRVELNKRLVADWIAEGRSKIQTLSRQRMW